MAIRLTRAGDYAIRGMIYLAEQPEGRITTISEIADKKLIPKNFLAKVFKDLNKAGLVKSIQGVSGGFLLSKPKEEITLRKIVETVEGGIFLNNCLMHEGECPLDQTCQAHHIWQKAQLKLLEILEEANLALLTQDNPGSHGVSHK